MHGAPTGYIVPPGTSFLVILPDSRLILWWDLAIRWLAIYFFMEVPLQVGAGQANLEIPAKCPFLGPFLRHLLPNRSTLAELAG